jgi:hypothetical protein
MLSVLAYFLLEPPGIRKTGVRSKGGRSSMEEHEAEVYFVGALSRTRSDKMLQRIIQDVPSSATPYTFDR